MKREESPIKGDHSLFARALVALAREHGVGLIDATFSLTSSERFCKESWDPARVRLEWAEGRHGDNGAIVMKAESYLTISEKPEEDE